VIPGAGEWWHLGYRIGVSIRHPYWAISNLTIRGGNTSAVTFGTGSGFLRGSGSVLDSVRVLVGCASGVITNNGETVAGWEDSILVRNCIIDGRRTGYPYAVFGTGASGDLWGHGLQFSAGFANTGYNNIVRGNFLGYEGYNGVSSTATGDTITSSDNYIGFNQFTDNTNAQMDFNGKALSWGSINAIFEQNVCRGAPATTGSAYAASTMWRWDNPPRGPQWLIRNHAYGGGGDGMFTMSGGGAGGAISTIVMYHNTLNGSGSGFLDQSSNADRGRIISRNNIYATRKQSTDTNVQAQLQFNVDDPVTYDFDYDMLDSTTKNFSIIRWGLNTAQGGGVSVKGLARDYGQEVHGIQGAYSPIDSTRSSAWPAAVTSGSAANVNAGVVIPGINTPLFGKLRYSGRAPDIGAYEWIAPTDSLNMPLNPNNRLWRKLNK
jgi:hypothetical protein